MKKSEIIHQLGLLLQSVEAIKSKIIDELDTLGQEIERLLPDEEPTEPHRWTLEEIMTPPESRKAIRR